MAPPPPLTGLPQATPALHPPPIPGGRLPPPFLGNKPGLCGLTSDEWHLVMKICIPALFIVIIAIIILRLNSYKIEDLWFWVQEHAKMTRMGLRERLFGHLLSEDDVRSGLINTGPIIITPRRYPTVDFIVAQLIPPPPMRREP